MSFLKAGSAYADALSTVSPTYAREIQRAPLGFGLQGLLARAPRSLTGILNGIDTSAVESRDRRGAAARYDADTLARKAGNKRRCSSALGLPAGARCRCWAW